VKDLELGALGGDSATGRGALWNACVCQWDGPVGRPPP